MSGIRVAMFRRSSSTEMPRPTVSAPETSPVETSPEFKFPRKFRENSKFRERMKRTRRRRSGKDSLDCQGAKHKKRVLPCSVSAGSAVGDKRLAVRKENKKGRDWESNDEEREEQRQGVVGDMRVTGGKNKRTREGCVDPARREKEEAGRRRQWS